MRGSRPMPLMLRRCSGEAFATFTLTPGDLSRFCLGLDADGELAVEASGNSAWFRDQVVSCVGRVVVVNPRQFKVIRSSVKKTARNDARALALFVSKDLLPETRAKTQGQSELGSLVHTRDLLVKQRTRLPNKIDAIPNRHGIKLKNEGLASRKRLTALGGNRLVRSTLVQCTLVAVRYSPYLKTFYNRINDRRGAGKALIATARKLLTIIYDTFKNGWVSSDFTTSSRSAPALAAGQSS